MKELDEPDDPELREILRSVRSIAVVGIKADPAEDAHRVPAYLKAQGYRILPVNPKLGRVLGETAYPRLVDVPEPIDLVNVFRAPQHVAAHADEILGLPRRPRAVWLQLGIRDDTSARRLEAAGIRVIQDRCLMLDHRRLGDLT